MHLFRSVAIIIFFFTFSISSTSYQRYSSSITNPPEALAAQSKRKPHARGHMRLPRMYNARLKPRVFSWKLGNSGGAACGDYKGTAGQVATRPLDFSLRLSQRGNKPEYLCHGLKFIDSGHPLRKNSQKSDFFVSDVDISRDWIPRFAHWYPLPRIPSARGFDGAFVSFIGSGSKIRSTTGYGLAHKIK